MLFAGCTNTGTVNILIANTSPSDCRNARVAVAMSDINTHLNIKEDDTLFSDFFQHVVIYSF